jgi:hypothetical protein
MPPPLPAALVDRGRLCLLHAGDKINIIGVVLDGTALASTIGIQFGSGGSLTVAIA